jgi:hypothetical protein
VGVQGFLVLAVWLKGRYEMARTVFRLAAGLAASSFLVFGLAAIPAMASSPFGAVTIVTAIDFSTFPFHGTFTVTDGASLIGCTDGTFVDHPIMVGSASVIQKNLTCVDGSSAGSLLVVDFHPGPSPGPGLANGHWEVNSGTGAFTNLVGGGDFSVSPTGPTSGVETLAGKVQFPS